MKMVKVGRVGGKIIEVCLADEASVNDALFAATLVKDNKEDIWINHNVGTSDSMVVNGDTIILEDKKVTISKVSDKCKRIIDILIDEDMICSEDYENEYDDIDYNEIYDDYNDLLDALLKG